jgi:serine/threonine protein kinase
LAERQFIGKYELLHCIATGGMAEVYLARQTGPAGFEKLLVIKRILPHLASQPRFVQMFLDEARLAARFNHPHIVQIYDLGQEGEDFYLAMEYINGEDLRAVVKQCSSRKERIPVEHVVRIFIGVLDALNYAHSQTDLEGRRRGVVHRDVSPHNILVSFEGGVKLVDFGIAKARSEISTTLPGRIKGKHAYMSPEQCLGRELDGRSDIFSAGIVLYELLSWSRLFKRKSDIETLKAVVACEVKPLRSLKPEIDPELDAIVLKALQPRPEDRYQTARQMQLALEDYVLKRGLKSNSALLAEYMNTLFDEKIAAREKALRQAQAPSLEGVVLGKNQAPDLVAFLDMFFPQKPEKTLSSSSGPEYNPDFTPSAEMAGLEALAEKAAVKPRTPEKAAPVPTPAPQAPLPPGLDLLSELPRASQPKPAAEPPYLPPSAAGSAEDVPLAEPNLAVPPAANQPDYPRQDFSPAESPRGRGFAILMVLVLGAVAALVFGLFKDRQPPSRAPATGRIMVKSIPSGADVYFDGQRLADLTPTEIDRVEPGIEHQLEVKHPAFPAWRKTVSLTDTTRPLEIEAVLNPQAVQKARLAGKPIIAGLEGKALGAVQIVSDPPGARIYLDGVLTGRKTPALLKNLSAEQDHVVMLELEKFAPAFNRFAVGEGQTHQLELKLEPGEQPPTQDRITVHVESEPEGARVVVNGYPLSGKTPLAVKLLAGGPTEIVVEKDGYRSWSATVRPLEGVDLTFFARLMKK